MTPDDKQPELELDRPARTSSSPSTSRLSGVRSAARSDVGLPPVSRQRLTKARLKEGAVDTILNTFSILGEVLEDFRTSDRFFKYKALVLSVWLMLTVGAFGVACPGFSGPANDIDAHLVVSGDGIRPVYLVKNESSEPWLDVVILVNGAYRSTLTRIEPNGGNVTLSPAVIFDETGKRAPADLHITRVEVQVTEPEASVVLLADGVAQE